jgi:hypothetical protein
MPIFTTKLIHRELTLSPFSSQQMMDIGQIMVNAKSDRISRAVDSTDSPALALADRYAKRKLSRGRAPVRDWNWRGLTMRSLKVKSASEDHVTIGFVNAEADQIVTVQRRRCEMFSDSPRDTAALTAAVRASLQQVSVIRTSRGVA